jgi:hypothetical protein
LRTAFLADLVFAMDFPQSSRARSGDAATLKTADLRPGMRERAASGQ